MIDGQWQIGNDYTFGSNTQVVVSGVEFEGYEVNNYDFNRENTDEIVMGRDSFKPGLVTFELTALDNYSVSTEMDVPGFQRAREVYEEFTKYWRGDQIRNLWNQYLPLAYKRHGTERLIYGRPRKLTPLRVGQRKGNQPFTCQYQTADTFTYSRMEYYEDGPVSTLGTRNVSVRRDLLDGQADTWFAIQIEGPITNPTVEIGPDMRIKLQTTLAAGKLIEISSYPWRRRVINSDGYTLSAFLIEDSPYMDELKIPGGEATDFGLSGSGTSGNTLLRVLWREAYYAY